MIDGFILVVAVLTAVGSGLSGGVFFAFSTFVMRAIRSRPPAEGLAAMQAINVTAVEPPFMLLFFGPALGSLALLIAIALNWDAPASGFLAAGSLLYVLGVFTLTAVYHVPRNNALAELDPAAPESASGWAQYAKGWTAWNHVRTVSAGAAALAFTTAIRVG